MTNRVKLNPVLRGRCPVCHFEEFHLVSCQLGQSEAENARLKWLVKETMVGYANHIGMFHDYLSGKGAHAAKLEDCSAAVCNPRHFALTTEDAPKRGTKERE